MAGYLGFEREDRHRDLSLRVMETGWDKGLLIANRLALEMSGLLAFRLLYLPHKTYPAGPLSYKERGSAWLFEGLHPGLF